MIIDTHVHFSGSPGFAEQHAQECARLGIAKVCLLGGTWENRRIEGGILAAMAQYPKLYLGFGMLQLGKDHPDAVSAFKDAGFTGLKCIRPAARYDDKAYYPHYQAPDKSQPWEKILFGSDVDTEVVEDVIADYRRTMAAVGLTPEMQDKVWSGNAARLLRLPSKEL